MLPFIFTFQAKYVSCEMPSIGEGVLKVNNEESRTPESSQQGEIRISKHVFPVHERSRVKMRVSTCEELATTLSVLSETFINVMGTTITTARSSALKVVKEHLG